MIARALRWAANDVPVWAWLLLVTLALLALTGCQHPVPPPVFALPVEPLAPPDPPPVAAATGDACPDAALVPGEALPVEIAAAVRIGGSVAAVASCRGQIMADATWDEYAALEDAAAYWQGIAEVQHDARVTDRAIAEAEAARRWEGWQEAHRDARALRWAGLGLGVSGLVVGVFVGVVAAGVAP